MERILVIGAGGQLGTELVEALIRRHGTESVIATDLQIPEHHPGVHFETLDVLDREQLDDMVISNKITTIYHLAALLSGNAEKHPLFAWKLNMEGLLNVLELGRVNPELKIFWPSSIGVFGPTTPKEDTQQSTIMEPNTVYGISKMAGERWCQYYFEHYNVDVRSLRYPGLIGYKSLPGGGTTDYAVDIFYKAIQGENFECFLKEDTVLPMMYIEDAVRATIELMEAPAEKISVRSSYNLAAFSFSPSEIYEQIKLQYPDFDISYAPDFRQQIADSWPATIDDSKARQDWQWQEKYDLEGLVEVMITNLSEKLVHN